ncbi:hypothetical protein C8R31_10491 [Nitrosospira sp. Nsp2]|uniref:hypothetical protein n=1 Tax=Nitrosospira sp. Nsp2 TaxID=136548 RepID=UPI000D479FD0|nr:hypothetical protein [Nitrosospira sp. Nsp2]PTR15064.1 hypothetical protein C8R31_10491 [Nitrosospira sp. Nsp2]
MSRFVPRELRAMVMRDLAEFVPANYYGELGEYDIETAILDHMLGQKLSYSAAYSGIPKRKRRASDLLVHFGYYRMSTFWVNSDRKSPSWLEFFGPKAKTAAGLEHFKNSFFGDASSLVKMEEDFPRRVREYAACLPADEKDGVLAFIEERDPEAAHIGSTVQNLQPVVVHWKMRIQEQAAFLWRKYKAMGSSPTKNSIKGDLAKWCRDNNVISKSGINPSEDYIYRHVLSGWIPPTD